MSLPDSVTLTETLAVDVRGRRTERFLGGVALLAVAIAWLLQSALTPSQASFLFIAAAAFTLLGLWSQGWLGGERRLVRVCWLADGRWLLADGRDSRQAAQLLPDSRIGNRWLWLRWQTESDERPRRRSMLLLAGDVSPSDLRRLIVRLRLQSQVSDDRKPSRRRQVCAEFPGA